MIDPPDKLPRNLGDLLARAGGGDRTVLIDLQSEDCPVELSANDFVQHVRTFAGRLKGLGIEVGQRVGFLTVNRWEMLVAYLGTMYMGAVAVPINHKFPHQTIAYIIRDANVTLMFADEGCKPLVPGSVRTIGFGDGERINFHNFMEPSPITVFEPDETDIAQILYTSGSTGVPKGVPLTHTGQLWALNHYLAPIGAHKHSERSLIVAPLYHMNALFYSSVCLLNTMTLVLQARFDARNYVDAIATYQCTHLSGVPTMFAMVAALDIGSLPGDLTCVKNIGIGSAPLSEAVLNQIGEIFPAAEISNGYGTTEAGPAVFGPHPMGKPRPRLSVGYPFSDVQWRLADNLSRNEGMLELKTTALTKGYLNRPDANGERFEDGWFKTNDVMRRDDDGFFYFVSRADDMFVCGGENIYPGEVEALLDRHPAVQQSLVVGAPDNIKGMIPVAFVVPKPDLQVSESTIKAFCIENGPAYAHPRRVLFKKSLPVGGTHKIDRRPLEREAVNLMVTTGRTTAS